MFWAEARRRYAHLTRLDPDISRYLDVAGAIQSEGYRGITGFIQDLGHKWIAARTPSGKVLEIGFGVGRHARFFRHDPQDHFVSEYAAQHVQGEAWVNARGRAVRCDAARIPFASGSFTCVISIYNLEHIAQLQLVLAEVHRVLASGGRFLIALPCEGGLLWNLGRELTTRRTFQRAYGIDYDKVIAYEHVWDLRGVLSELESSGLFEIIERKYFPFGIASVNASLICCLDCVSV